MTCGSKTLRIKGEDAICMKCGHKISNFKELKNILGVHEYKAFYNGLEKEKNFNAKESTEKES